MCLESRPESRPERVLITGASGGLGRALALELAARGAKVALVARREKELKEVVKLVRARRGDAIPLVYDVGDKDAVYPLVAIAQERIGPIDTVIHNASTLGAVPLRPLLDTDCEALEDAVRVNLVGPFRLTKALVPSFLTRGRGLVVFVSSDAAVQAYPSWGPYGATKAAADHLARTLAEETKGTGVRVLSVDPGEMDTDMHAAAMPDADRAALAKPETMARRLIDRLSNESWRSGDRIELSAEGP